MVLEEKEWKYFFSIWKDLLGYVNDVHKITSQYSSEFEYATVESKITLPIRNKLWEDDTIIDSYISSNKSLNLDEKQILKSWKDRVADVELPQNIFMGGNKELERLINNIFDAVKRGNVGSNELLYTKFLMNLANSKDQFAVLEKPENLEERLTAIRLLGKIGGIEIMPFLSELFLSEKNITIKSTIAEAIGDIGMDNGDALDAFSSLATNKNAPGEERLLAAVIKALSHIARYSDSDLTKRAIALIVEIKNSTKSVLVTAAAKESLDGLFRSW
ncbi:MAG: hypothetical protein Ta2B_30450 [Termitinemataceae bacterium]|nr:MAG: hypothetical protein Ta2B_30450 [Termitinemataceae bacterium]